jgi:aldehyde:ferredoxin oxidoreductase
MIKDTFVMQSRVIEIDLTKREVKELTIDPRPWLGGRGLAVKLFTDRVDPSCDPLGPENVMVIAASALTGTAAPTAGRGHAVFKSPGTGAIGSANSGGRWAKVLKSAGCDALVIRGGARTPVYISISGQVTIHDAADLWGREVPEVSELLAARHGGRESSVLAIGPAGENKVRFAALMNENNRAYGRGGPGAVLGAKQVKAIVVKGSARTEVADPARFQDAVEQARHVMKAQPVTKRVLRDLGTAGLVHLINEMRMLPRRNFQNCIHEPELIERISGETIRDQILERAGGCWGCPILCQRHTRIGDHHGEGPEFETVVLMGPLLDIYDLEAITLANYRANELGLDTMSLGGTLAGAVELFERGAITKADAGGVELRFGNSELYPGIVDRIARREGIGDWLAEGSRRLAERFEHPEAAMQVKGLELPAYDPRGMAAQALGYMTSPTGACHLRGGYSIALAFFGGIREVPRFSIRQAAMTCKNQQDLGIIQDSLGICRFTGYATGAEHWARIYGAAIGEEFSRAELEAAAERIATLERLFNVRAGFSRKDDDLPARFKTEPIVIGRRERIISEQDRERMLDDYYQVRGWDREGVPQPETLSKLRIGN